MEIETSARFDKNYRRLPKKLKEVAKQKEIIFRTIPFHPTLNTHKLHGIEKGVWAFSINQKYRIKFVFLAGETVLFLDVGTHDVYR